MNHFVTVNFFLIDILFENKFILVDKSLFSGAKVAKMWKHIKTAISRSYRKHHGQPNYLLNDYLHFYYRHLRAVDQIRAGIQNNIDNVINNVIDNAVNNVLNNINNVN